MGDNGESDDEDIDLKLFIDAIDFMPSFEIESLLQYVGNCKELDLRWLFYLTLQLRFLISYFVLRYKESFFNFHQWHWIVSIF